MIFQGREKNKIRQYIAVTANHTENRVMSIQIAEESGKVLLSTRNMSYGIGISPEWRLPVNLHWGGRLSCAEELTPPEEITFFDNGCSSAFYRTAFCRLELASYTRDYIYEPCLKVRSPFELEELRLQFSGWSVPEEEHFRLDMSDPAGMLNVSLHYRLIPELDLIQRWTEVRNTSDREIVFENLFSASWTFPRARHWRLSHLEGGWGREFIVAREPVVPGEKVLESRTGTSGHQHAPVFALDGGNATESSGEVYFGTILWSGNWKMIAELDEYREMRICGGYNNFDFECPLAPGETQETPLFIGGFTKDGFGGMSRRLHRWHQHYLYPENMRNKPMSALYNSFGCLRGPQVTEKNILALIPKAAAVGIETFIIDDGWQKSFGDWVPHPERFPNGLGNVVALAHSLRMTFGLWVEIERAQEDSEVARLHPEWLVDDSGYSLLNFALPEVLDYVYAELAALIRENGIDYIKTDFNRYLGVPHFRDRRSMRTRYLNNFYTLLKRLRAEFPDVFFENCAAGAGRLDMEMDRYFSRINRSDNQDPLAVLGIHEGFTWLHPSKMAGGGCHISRAVEHFNHRSPIPLSFMAHVGMMGWLSLGLPLDRSSKEELEECAEYIRLYKRIRHVTHLGELHRLASYTETGSHAAFEFVMEDASEAVLFLFAHNLRYDDALPEFRLEALDPEAWYRIDRYAPSGKEYGKPDPPPRPQTGRFLMEHGIRAMMNGDLDSRIFHLRRIGEQRGNRIEFELPLEMGDGFYSLFLNGSSGPDGMEILADGELVHSFPPHCSGALESKPFFAAGKTLCHVGFRSKGEGTICVRTPVLTELYYERIGAEFFLEKELGRNSDESRDCPSGRLVLDCSAPDWHPARALNGVVSCGSGYRYLAVHVYSPDAGDVRIFLAADYFWQMRVNGTAMTPVLGGPSDPKSARRMKIGLEAGWNKIVFYHGAGSCGSWLDFRIANPGILKYRRPCG